MLNLKKTAVAVLALGSSAVFAGTMGPVCTPGAVTVPCERTAWDFGIQALYLQTTGSDYIGYLDNTTASNHEYKDWNNEWDWGFRLEGSYHFGTGNDISVNWLHFDQEDNHANFASNFAGGLANSRTFLNGPFTASFENELDAVNFEFAQTVNFGEHKVIRFHGGAQYANIERELKVWNFQNTTGNHYNLDTEFEGFGPRVGMDMSYHFGNGFAIYANGATALLIGETKFNDAFAPTVSLITGTPRTAHGERDVVVPELEVKLGATYTFAMAQGDISLDAGWMVVNYFDALQGPASGDQDFAVNGPYIGAKWVGNVA